MVPSTAVTNPASSLRLKTHARDPSQIEYVVIPSTVIPARPSYDGMRNVSILDVKC